MNECKHEKQEYFMVTYSDPAYFVTRCMKCDEIIKRLASEIKSNSIAVCIGINSVSTGNSSMTLPKEGTL